MRPEQKRPPLKPIASPVAPSLPLSIAFARLIFSIFPALIATFGVGPKKGVKGQRTDRAAATTNPDRRNGKCHKQQLNNGRETRQQDECYYRSLPDRLYAQLHPYRALGKTTLLPSQKLLNEMDLPAQSHLFMEQQHHFGDEMGTTIATTTTTTATQPDYGELQFYGQLKKLLDLPVLFAICFVQLISFVLVLVLNIEECSPLVLFSWWRNKIS